jgi:hypothetical protein
MIVVSVNIIAHGNLSEDLLGFFKENSCWLKLHDLETSSNLKWRKFIELFSNTIGLIEKEKLELKIFKNFQWGHKKNQTKKKKKLILTLSNWR